MIWGTGIGSEHTCHRIVYIVYEMFLDFMSCKQCHHVSKILCLVFLDYAGLSVLTTDADGFDHSIVIEVEDPHNLESSCPAGVSPCVADGSLRVLVDGVEELSQPGTVFLAPDVQVSAVNLPGACRSFGFEKVRQTMIHF